MTRPVPVVYRRMRCDGCGRSMPLPNLRCDGGFSGLYCPTCLPVPSALYRPAEVGGDRG